MKIGIDAHMLGDHSGGNERFYENILGHMVVPEDAVFFLFVQQGTDTAKYKDRFEVIELQSHSAATRYLRELPKLSRKLELDVLHTQYFIPPFGSCRTVCTIHDICFEHNASWFAKKDYVFQKLLIPRSARHADHIVTVSEYSAQDLVRTYGISAGKISVIYNAADDSFLQLQDQQTKETSARDKFGIGTDPYILSVGNLNPRKNLSRLIRAFGLMKKRWGGSEKLVIAGKKDYRAEELLSGIRQDVVFTGFVSDEELVELYRGADVFVYPSLYEGFGIPPLEAMACGTPVAVSDRTSLPEVVGDAGLYFDPEDEQAIAKCLHRLLTDKELCAGLTQKGRQRCRAFDWTRSAGDMVEVYYRAAGHDGPPAHTN